MGKGGNERVESAAIQVGDVVAGRYRVERTLGSGGMGVVVRATHLTLHCPVALKFMRAEFMGRPEAKARFLQEARSAARLHSEHVARVLDVAELDDRTLYMALEYLEGADLGTIVDRNGPLSPGEAVHYALMACHAIAEAHSLGIVHRDLKPENLFLTRGPDGRPSIKVLDFGISKVIDPECGRLTRTAGAPLMGSPLYMSPEQMSAPRDVDGRADVWGLGASLFVLLTGSDAFDAATTALICANVLREPAPLLTSFGGGVPVALERVVLRCLAKDRGARFASMGELARALAPFAPVDARSYVARIERIERGGSAPDHRRSETRAAFEEPAGVSRDRPIRRTLVTLTLLVAIACVGFAVTRDFLRTGPLASALGIGRRGVSPPAVTIERPLPAPLPTPPEAPSAAARATSEPDDPISPPPPVEAPPRPATKGWARPRPMPTKPRAPSPSEPTSPNGSPSAPPPENPAPRPTVPDSPPSDPLWTDARSSQSLSVIGT